MNRPDQKTRARSWRALLAEGAVIVVSILLAFSLDAWWEDRQERRVEREHMLALRAELAQSILGLDEVIDSVTRHAANVDRLIKLIDEAGGEPITLPAELLGSAVMWRTSDVSTSTLDALMASGNLNLLSDPELRRELAGLPAVLQDVREDEELARDFAEFEMSAALARAGLAEIAYAYRPGRLSPGYPQEVTVQVSPEIVGLLAARRTHFGFSLGGLPLVRTYVAGILERIDANLGTPR